MTGRVRRVFAIAAGVCFWAAGLLELDGTTVGLGLLWILYGYERWGAK